MGFFHVRTRLVIGIRFCRPAHVGHYTNPQLTMSIKVSSDGLYLVDTTNVMHNAKTKVPPKHVMLLCGNIHSGKTVHSQWREDQGFTHWAAFPVFPKEDRDRTPPTQYQAQQSQESKA